MLNGVWAYMNQKPAINDRLLVRVCENKKSENIVPVDIKLDIRYEDEDIIVINKGSDMPIHPSLNNYELQGVRKREKRRYLSCQI